MTWRLARSLIVLRDQVNKLAPNRSHESDGAIGDEHHSSRTSDHNPNEAGVVCAIDVTNDPAGGLSSEALAEALRVAKDPRLHYVISNKKIASAPGFSWQPYHGINPHNHHCHISVKQNEELYDMTTLWDFILGRGVDGTSPPSGGLSSPPSPVLRKGDKGQYVEALQVLLNKHGLSVVEDGKYGPDTREAVIVYQNKNGLVADGVVGRYTWDALRGK